MKKLITLLLVFTFVLVGCGANQNAIKQENITIAQIEEKIEKKETFAFVVASKTCSHCNALKAMLKEYKSDKTIYIFETTTASKEDIQKLLTRFPNIDSTPTTIFFENGVVKDTEVGYDKPSITAKLNSFFK